MAGPAIPAMAAQAAAQAAQGARGSSGGGSQGDPGNSGREAIQALLALLGPVVFLGLVMLLIFGLIVTLFGELQNRGCTPGTAGPADVSPKGKEEIPAQFLSIYTDAAQRFELGPDGWSVLASIHKHENGFHPGGGAPTSSAGALGPMQFMPGTWAAYGVDGNNDGRKDVQNVHDAIFGAANYLRASGAPGDWDRAIYAYNHADWYVAMISGTAAGYRGGGTPATTQLASLETGGGCTCDLEGEAPTVQPAASLPQDAPPISWPVESRTVISGFGPRWGTVHEGIDLPLPIGTPLRAAAAGNVTQAGEVSGYGLYTCIQHAVSFATCYGHQSEISVEAGQHVDAGAVIGLSGNSGISTGPHLHFETRLGAGLAAEAKNPMLYLPGGGGNDPEVELASNEVDCAPGELPGELIEGGSLLWPTTPARGEVIGFPYQGTHSLGNWQSDNALDIGVPVGTPIVAVADGEICRECGFGGAVGTGSGRFDGMHLTLNTADNQVFYTHLQGFAAGIERGTRVKRGQLIGYSWKANSVPHLHIGVKNGNPLDLFGARAPAARSV